MTSSFKVRVDAPDGTFWYVTSRMIADTKEKTCDWLNKASIRNGTNCTYSPASAEEYRAYYDEIAEFPKS